MISDSLHLLWGASIAARPNGLVTQLIKVTCSPSSAGHTRYRQMHMREKTQSQPSGEGIRLFSFIINRTSSESWLLMVMIIASPRRRCQYAVFLGPKRNAYVPLARELDDAARWAMKARPAPRSARRCPKGAPPAMLGTILSWSPASNGVFSPCRPRTSSPLRKRLTYGLSRSRSSNRCWRSAG